MQLRLVCGCHLLSGGTSVEIDSKITAEQLFNNGACWHASCKRPFERDKVARFFANLFMREKAVDEQVVQPSKRGPLDLDSCIFCELPSWKEGLRQF